MPTQKSLVARVPKTTKPAGSVRAGKKRRYGIVLVRGENAIEVRSVAPPSPRRAKGD